MSNKFHARNGIVSHGSVDVLDNTITNSNTNGNVDILPNGTGRVNLKGMLFPAADGLSGQVLSTNGAGNLSWATVSAAGGPIALADLTDVTTSGAVTGNALVFDNGEWKPGSVAPTYSSKTANFVLAAPNGADGVPDFRLLVAADIPALDWAKITSGKPTTLAGYGITDGLIKNTLITGATKTKITYDAKGLVLAGADLVESDIPALSAAKITSGVLSVDRLGSGTANSTKWLRGDGTWADAPAAGTPDFGTKAAMTFLAGPITGVDAAPTFRLITATDVPSLDAAKITTGTFGVARLGSGTADTTKFLRGDGTWATVPAGAPTFADQAANLVFAGPTTGVNAQPAFRSLVAADIPALDWSKITSGKPTTLAGYGITDGLVKNNAITGGTYPKISFDSKGLVTGGAGLTAADIPALDAAKITSGVFDSALIPDLNASKITAGLLPLARGGSGADLSSLANNQIVVKSGSALTGLTAPSTANTYLKWDGTAFSWSTVTASAGITIKDEGATQGSVSGVTTVNFVGAGVTASVSGDTATVTIPGGTGTTIEGCFKIKFDGNGNIVDPANDASWVYDMIGDASSWTFTRVSQSQLRITHNKSGAAGSVIIPEVWIWGFNTTVNGYVQKPPTANPTAGYSVVHENTTQNGGAPQPTAFSIYGLTAGNSQGTGGHAFFRVRF